MTKEHEATELEDGKSIYQQMVDAGQKISSHATDLYVKVTPESRAIINAYRFKCNVTTFISQLDHERWYDIPFAYDPAWEAKYAKV